MSSAEPDSGYRSSSKASGFCEGGIAPWLKLRLLVSTYTAAAAAAAVQLSQLHLATAARARVIAPAAATRTSTRRSAGSSAHVQAVPPLAPLEHPGSLPPRHARLLLLLQQLLLLWLFLSTTAGLWCSTAVAPVVLYAQALHEGNVLLPSVVHVTGHVACGVVRNHACAAHKEWHSSGPTPTQAVELF